MHDLLSLNAHDRVPYSASGKRIEDYPILFISDRLHFGRQAQLVIWVAVYWYLTP
jgi:hypothetical protein